MEPSPRIVVCMTSHNRIDCARISQEIIKLNYAAPLPIVHASSSGRYDGYLEDAFASVEPRPLHAGAINLVQTTLRMTRERFPQATNVVHLESDVWLLDERVVHAYVDTMARTGALLATCAWSDTVPRGRATRVADNARRLLELPPRRGATLPPMDDLSTQFFIMRMDPVLVDAVLGIVPASNDAAEVMFHDAFTAHFGMERVVRMVEREPVLHHRYWCEAQSLYCQHWPARGTAHDPRPWWDDLYVAPHFPGKRDTLRAHPAIRRGDHLNRLLVASDLSYYNEGAIRY